MDKLPALFAAAVLAFALHAGLLYFSSAILAGVLSAAVLAVVLLTVTGCGRMLLRHFEVRGLGESEKTLIGATLGLGLLSQTVFLLGIVGWLRTWSVSLLLGAFWILGFTELRDLILSLGANRSLLRDRPLLAGGILAFLGLMFWFTWVPPHQYDALVYHLPLADVYAREGAIRAVEHLLFTHFPQNGEMLYTFSLLLGTDILAQMFTWLGTFLSVWWILEMGKRETSITVTLLACFFTVTHTAVLLLTPTSYVECLVMLWVTASVLSFLRWRMRSDEEQSVRGWLALSGIFAGLGVGTKYYAGICPALLGLYLLAEWLRMRPWSQGGSYVNDRLRDGAVFSTAAFAAGAPWLVKNALTVGNPFFPFFYRLMPPRGVGWSETSAAAYFGILTEYGHSRGHFLADLVSFPYLAATGSQRFGGGADVLGDLGWGLTFIAAPAAIWAAWRSRYLRFVLAYCAAHWALWFSTGVVLRFLVVLIPLSSLLTAQGLHKIFERLEDSGKFCLAAGVGVILWTNLTLFLYVHSVVGSLGVLTGLQSRGQYLSEKLDYYPCAAHARDRIPGDAKILVVGEQRGYYVKQPHVTTSPMAPNRFVQLANEAADSRQLGLSLKEEGFRYMLFVPRESKRLGEGYGVFHFSERGYANWTGLESGGIAAEYEAPGRCVLFKLL